MHTCDINDFMSPSQYPQLYSCDKQMCDQQINFHFRPQFPVQNNTPKWQSDGFLPIDIFGQRHKESSFRKGGIQGMIYSIFINDLPSLAIAKIGTIKAQASNRCRAATASKIVWNATKFRQRQRYVLEYRDGYTENL